MPGKRTMPESKRIGWWYTHLGEAEKDRVLEAFDHRRFSMGPVAGEFERQFAEKLGVKHVVLAPSGTASLTMALLAAGVGPGDEVIVPALTWIATGNAVALLGARVVLADCQPDSPLVDVSEIEKNITSRTRAIIPVHLNGRACQLDDIKALIADRDITLIEDTCKAMFSRTPQGNLGTLGDLGCFSLGLVSLISIGYGGAVVTNRDDLYEKLLLVRNQGVPAQGEERYVMPSFNFKVSDILAAVGLAQLARLNEKLNHLRAIYDTYVAGLNTLSFLDVIPVDYASGKVALCFEVRSREREAILRYLDDNNIEGLRFHLPLHRALYLDNTGEFPNAAAYAAEGFILPCGPSQPLERVQRCVEVLQAYPGGRA